MDWTRRTCFHHHFQLIESSRWRTMASTCSWLEFRAFYRFLFSVCTLPVTCFIASVAHFLFFNILPFCCLLVLTLVVVSLLVFTVLMVPPVEVQVISINSGFRVVLLLSHLTGGLTSSSSEAPSCLQVISHCVIKDISLYSIN